MAVEHRWPLRHDQRLQLLMYGSLRHRAFEGTGAEREIGRWEVEGRVFLSGRAVVRMRVDVRAASPSHRRRRLEGGLVFLVGHCVWVVLGASGGWREHSDGNSSSTGVDWTGTFGLGRQLGANNAKGDRRECRCNQQPCTLAFRSGSSVA